MKKKNGVDICFCDSFILVGIGTGGGGKTMKRKQINKVISHSDNEWEENETGILLVHGGWASLWWSGKALLKDNILPEVQPGDCPATRDLRCREFQVDEKFRSPQKIDEKFRSPKM